MDKNGSFSIHHRNLSTLVIDMFKFLSRISPKVCALIFKIFLFLLFILIKSIAEELLLTFNVNFEYVFVNYNNFGSFHPEQLLKTSEIFRIASQNLWKLQVKYLWWDFVLGKPLSSELTVILLMILKLILVWNFIMIFWNFVSWF